MAMRQWDSHWTRRKERQESEERCGGSAVSVTVASDVIVGGVRSSSVSFAKGIEAALVQYIRD